MPAPAVRWKWTNFYDPVKSLNPHFYRCATIIAKLPGPSQLHVTLLDDVDMFGLQNLPGTETSKSQLPINITKWIDKRAHFTEWIDNMLTLLNGLTKALIFEIFCQGWARCFRQSSLGKPSLIWRIAGFVRSGRRRRWKLTFSKKNSASY